MDTNVDALNKNPINVSKVDEYLKDEIPDCRLLQSSQLSNETKWIGKKSSKMGLMLQQLGNQILLNHLFMVEVGKVGITSEGMDYTNNIIVFDVGLPHL
jgi:hypothetical protein